jgi:hypothetical protein
MGQILHGSARTTAALRRAIQQSQESIAKLPASAGSLPRATFGPVERHHMEGYARASVAAFDGGVNEDCGRCFVHLAPGSLQSM